MSDPHFHKVVINNIERDLPLCNISPGVNIAVFNMLGDVEITQAAAQALSAKLASVQIDSLITAETKSIPLIYEMAKILNCPYVILRKHCKKYMGDAIYAESESITTGKVQRLYLDEKDQQHLRSKNVVIVDDVISTGSTLEAIQSILKQTQSNCAAIATVFTEGEQVDDEYITLGHLPIFS